MRSASGPGSGECAGRGGRNVGIVRAQRRRLGAAGSRAADRLLRGRRPKKLRIGSGHSRHGRLIPCHLRRGGRAVVVFSPTLGMTLLLFRIVRFLVLTFMPHILLLQAFVAVPMEGGWALEFAAVAAWRTLRLPWSIPSRSQREGVPREVSEGPADGDLCASRPATVV